VELSKFGDTIS